MAGAPVEACAGQSWLCSHQKKPGGRAVARISTRHHRQAWRVSHIPSPHRCPLKTLQKCEIALEKLKNDMAVVSGIPWPGGVQRATGISEETGTHPTSGEKCSKLGVGRGACHSAWGPRPEVFFQVRSALGKESMCANMGEVTLRLWSCGCSLHPPGSQTFVYAHLHCLISTCPCPA